VAVVGERLDGDVGDVVGVDERRGNVAGREPDLAAQDVLAHVVLAEVLHEPRRAQDGQLCAGVAHGPFRALGAGLAAAGEEDQAPHAVADGQFGEGPRRRHRPRERQVGVVREVHGAHALERRQPGRAVLPVERRAPGSRADSDRQAARSEPLDHPTTGLPRAAQDERRSRARRDASRGPEALLV
jgi:hypothetical protein